MLLYFLAVTNTSAGDVFAVVDTIVVVIAAMPMSILQLHIAHLQSCNNRHRLSKRVQLLPRLLLHGCNMLCTGHRCIYFTIFNLCRFVGVLDRG